MVLVNGPELCYDRVVDPVAIRCLVNSVTDGRHFGTTPGVPFQHPSLVRVLRISVASQFMYTIKQYSLHSISLL